MKCLFTSCCLICFDRSKSHPLVANLFLSGDIQNAGRVFQRSHRGLWGWWVIQPSSNNHGVSPKIGPIQLNFKRVLGDFGILFGISKKSSQEIHIQLGSHLESAKVGCFCIGTSPKFHLFEVS